MALEADGAALVFVSQDQPGATYRIGSEAAERLGSVLRALRPERPQILLDAGIAAREPWVDVAATRKASSLLAIPIYGNGTAAYLYLDRLAELKRSSFGPSHLNLCLALAPQLEALVDRAALESLINRAEEDSLHRRVFLADVVTQNSTLKLNTDKLERDKKQLLSCKIFAPQDGIAQFESVAREFRSDILGLAVTANENHGTGCY